MYGKAVVRNIRFRIRAMFKNGKACDVHAIGLSAEIQRNSGHRFLSSSVNVSSEWFRSHDLPGVSLIGELRLNYRIPRARTSHGGFSLAINNLIVSS
jgi:hypothetical protein